MTKCRNTYTKSIPLSSLKNKNLGYKMQTLLESREMFHIAAGAQGVPAAHGYVESATPHLESSDFGLMLGHCESSSSSKSDQTYKFKCGVFTALP